MDSRAKTIEDLHRRFSGLIFDKCMRMLANTAEADDAVQETFVSAFRSLDSFRYGDTHLPWLYRIATNMCLNRIRTRRRQGIAMRSQYDEHSPQTPDPVSELHIRRILNDLVTELDPRTLEILVAHYLDGMNQSDIATYLGISRRAVVKRLTSLRAKVQGALDEGNCDA